jgi:hypothetical protein
MFAATLALVGASAVARAHQPAAKMLPEDTLAFLRIADTQNLKDSFLKTSLGRIASDPQVAPLVRQLYGSGLQALSRVEDQLGTSIPDALSIFQGEIAIGLVPKEDGPPAAVILLDAGNQLAAAQKLLDHGLEIAEKNGSDKSEEMVDGVKFVTIRPRRLPQSFTYFVNDTTIVIGTDKDALKNVLGRWDDAKGKSLATNAQYSAIMHRCEGTKEQPAQLTWFVDPIATVKAFSRGNATAQIGLALLPTIGLDGLKGIGGSMILASGEFDSILHVHVLLDNPRAGAIALLQLGEGDVTPERWVPNDVQGYTTVYWDVGTTFDKLTTLIESFQGEGTFRNTIKSTVSDRIGVDVEKDLVPALAGRFTMTNWIEKPATSINAQATLVAAKLKDADKFQEVLDKVVAKFPERFTKKSYGGVTYYAVTREVRDLTAPEDLPVPAVAIIDGYLMGTNQVKFLEKIIRDKDDASNSLAKSLDFKLIMSKIARQSGEAKPGMISFDRPEEGLRMWYDLATGAKSRDRLKSRADNNRFFGALNDALEKNPLPPFAVIAKYLAPGGSMITNDDSGFHYTRFTLRRD